MAKFIASSNLAGAAAGSAHAPAIPKPSLVVPVSPVVVVVLQGGKLILQGKDRCPPNPSFEEKVGSALVVAYGEASRHRDFSGLCKTLRRVLHDRGSEAEPKAEKPAWCHYHKAEVGHTIDRCPDVKCRKCHLLGHTDRVCEAEACEVCGKFGHTAEVCRRRKCEVCSREGHSADKCFSQMTCATCGEVGHPTDRCFGPAPEKKIWCSYHQVEGVHYTSQCPDLKDWECENCGEVGHYYKNCRNPHIARPSASKVEVDAREFIYASGNAQPLRQKHKK
jgi:hypothetical protein